MLFSYLKKYFFNDYKFGTIVEVGAAGPDYLSQSKPFKDIGWRSICIEPNPTFSQMHRDVGNEIYEYAASDVESDDVDFQISTNCIEESFSSLGISTDLCVKSGYSGVLSISSKNIKVKVRKLDTILEEANVSKVDCVIVDVEGWELNVLKSFNTKKYKPKIIVLEVIGNEEQYSNYMRTIGYEFDSYDNTTGPNIIYSNKDY